MQARILDSSFSECLLLTSCRWHAVCLPLSSWPCCGHLQCRGGLLLHLGGHTAFPFLVYGHTFCSRLAGPHVQLQCWNGCLGATAKVELAGRDGLTIRGSVSPLGLGYCCSVVCLCLAARPPGAMSGIGAAWICATCVPAAHGAEAPDDLPATDPNEDRLPPVGTHGPRRIPDPVTDGSVVPAPDYIGASDAPRGPPPPLSVRITVDNAVRQTRPVQFQECNFSVWVGTPYHVRSFRFGFHVTSRML